MHTLNWILLHELITDCAFFHLNLHQILAKSKGLDWKQFKVLGKLQESLGLSFEDMLSFMETTLHHEPYDKKEVCGILGVSEEELNQASLSANTLDGETLYFVQRSEMFNFCPSSDLLSQPGEEKQSLFCLHIYQKNPPLWSTSVMLRILFEETSWKSITPGVTKRWTCHHFSIRSHFQTFFVSNDSHPCFTLQPLSLWHLRNKKSVKKKSCFVKTLFCQSRCACLYLAYFGCGNHRWVESSPHSVDTNT